MSCCDDTYGSIPAELRKLLGVTDYLIRVSIGLKNVENLIEDLD